MWFAKPSCDYQTQLEDRLATEFEGYRQILNLLPIKLTARSSSPSCYRHPDARMCFAQSMQKDPPEQRRKTTQ